MLRAPDTGMTSASCATAAWLRPLVTAEPFEDLGLGCIDADPEPRIERLDECIHPRLSIWSLLSFGKTQGFASVQGRQRDAEAVGKPPQEVDGSGRFASLDLTDVLSGDADILAELELRKIAA